MKKLHLREIMAKLGGKVVQGTLPTYIRHVVDHPSDVKADRTLLFDRFQRIRVRPFETYDGCVIVTEGANSWANIRNNHAVVRVKDVEEAYMSFVRHYRELFSIPVIAITGTCGKTTTKEMVVHILSKRYQVQATVRSKNDPLFNLEYLLGIEDSTNVAVFETGVGKKGDLLDCCRFFRPTVGVITNIGIDHLNAFASHDEYIQAKGEMLPGLEYTGTLLINSDDPNIQKIDLTSFHGKLTTFGFGEEADFRAQDVQTTPGCLALTVRYQYISHDLFLPGYGHHTVYNGLAAIATAHTLGVGIDEAAESLRSYKHLPGHLNVLPGINGSAVIDDSWNSNPTSMRAALKVLYDLAEGRHKIAVLGKMAALGDFADEQYAQISQQLVEQDVDVLITRGSIAKEFAKHALYFGMRQQNVFCCNEIAEIEQLLQGLMSENTIVLIKSSMKDYEIRTLVKHITL